ncbi:hypothetical protein BU16DRAFT_616218 [Lophium mytilinum]|uniref:Uncharacterized protein n=1 Tax=Lophium mytilinum TaxID=390894 RepID=A0A6A6QYR9_9PEZI|nr:hypothetical protein BU16DRAFT_616218 [Lophium mytilinum]
MDYSHSGNVLSTLEDALQNMDFKDVNLENIDLEDVDLENIDASSGQEGKKWSVSGLRSIDMNSLLSGFSGKLRDFKSGQSDEDNATEQIKIEEASSDTDSDQEPAEPQTNSDGRWSDLEIRDLAVLYLFGPPDFRKNLEIIADILAATRETTRTKEHIREFICDFWQLKKKNGHYIVKRATKAAAKCHDMLSDDPKVKGVFRMAKREWKLAKERNPKSALGQVQSWDGPVRQSGVLLWVWNRDDLRRFQDKKRLNHIVVVEEIVMEPDLSRAELASLEDALEDSNISNSPKTQTYRQQLTQRLEGVLEEDDTDYEGIFPGLKKQDHGVFSNANDDQQEDVPKNGSHTSQGHDRNNTAMARDAPVPNILLPVERHSHPGEPWTEAETRELAILYFFGHYEFRTNAAILSETITALRGTPRTEHGVRMLSHRFHKPEWRNGQIHISRATAAAMNAQEMDSSNWQVKSVFKRAEQAWMAAQEYSPESPLGKLEVWHGPNATPLKVPSTRLAKLKKVSETFAVFEEPRKRENDPVENTSFAEHRESEVNKYGLNDFETIGLD